MNNPDLPRREVLDLTRSSKQELMVGEVEEGEVAGHIEGVMAEEEAVVAREVVTGVEEVEVLPRVRVTVTETETEEG